MKMLSLIVAPAATAIVALIALIIMACLPGCATLESAISSNTLAAQLVVQEATARAIEVGQTPAIRYARAQQIATTATAIKQTFDTSATTLPGLVQLATARIAALKLQPADAIVAQALVTALSTAVSTKVCPGTSASIVCTIPPAQTVYVDTAISWVIAATQLYPAS